VHPARPVGGDFAHRRCEPRDGTACAPPSTGAIADDRRASGSTKSQSDGIVRRPGAEVSASRPKTTSALSVRHGAGPGRRHPRWRRSTRSSGSRRPSRSPIQGGHGYPAVAVAPNPLNRASTIFPCSRHGQGESCIRLFDAQGRLVHRSRFSMSPWPFRVCTQSARRRRHDGGPALPSGIYYLPHRDRGRRRDRAGIDLEMSISGKPWSERVSHREHVSASDT